MKTVNKTLAAVVLTSAVSMISIPAFATSDSANTMPMAAGQAGMANMQGGNMQSGNMPGMGDMKGQKGMDGMPMMGGMGGENGGMMKKMEERQAKMQAHMEKMEKSFGNIEALLAELVALQKKN